jgi:hypothetical protein
MATILPTTPIEMPDLAGQAFKLQEYRAGQKAEAAKEAREQQDRRRSQAGLDKAYAEAAKIGQLMPRYVPATQAAFDNYLKAGEQYAYSGLESDKQAFMEANMNYNKVFGGSLAKSELGMQNVNSYYSDPSKFAITGDEFKTSLEQFNSTPAGEEEILDVTTAFRLPAAEQIKFLQPSDMAKEASGIVLGPKVNDFSPDGVAFNKGKAVEFVEKQWLPSMLADPDFYTKAIIYGAKKTGWGGLHNKELSTADLERLRTLPADQKEVLVNEFRNDTMNQFRQTIPNSIGEYKQEKAERSDEVKRYENLKPADTGVQVGKLVIGKGTKENAKGKRTFTPTEKSKTVPMYELPSDAWIKTRNHTIVGFGKTTEKINGKYANIPYIRTIREDKDTGEEIREVRRATLEDLSVLKNKMKDTYYDYFDN